jgi:hypothetical protein
MQEWDARVYYDVCRIERVWAYDTRRSATDVLFSVWWVMQTNGCRKSHTALHVESRINLPFLADALREDLDRESWQFGFVGVCLDCLKYETP